MEASGWHASKEAEGGKRAVGEAEGLDSDGEGAEIRGDAPVQHPKINLVGLVKETVLHQHVHDGVV